MRILVTGATGNVGRHVVNQLVDRGVTVRALSRNPKAAALPDSVEVVEGDLDRPQEWSDALDGVDRLYLFPHPDTAREVVDLAKAAGVRRVVVLSSDAVTTGDDPGHHEPVERAVADSGLEWTFVRPGEFALNKIDTWGEAIRSAGVVRSAYADAPGVPVHEVDVAAVAVAALLEDGHAGQAYSVTGPQALTARAQVATIGAAIGRELGFEELTPAQAREDMVALGCPPDIADYILAHQAKGLSHPPRVQHTVKQVTGRPARTFEEWARDHAADFR